MSLKNHRDWWTLRSFTANLFCYSVVIKFKTSRVMGGISTEADGGYMKVGVNDDNQEEVSCAWDIKVSCSY